MIPRDTLATERLRLEPVSRKHGRALWAATEASLPELRPWLAWAVTASADASRRFATFAEREWRDGREHDFAVVETASDELVGTMGIRVAAPANPSGELGYWIRSDRAGRGYATEAGAAAVRFGFERLRLHRIEMGAATENHASRRVAEKLGFRHEGVKRQAGWGADGPHDLQWYGLLAADLGSPGSAEARPEVRRGG